MPEHLPWRQADHTSNRPGMWQLCASGTRLASVQLLAPANCARRLMAEWRPQLPVTRCVADLAPTSLAACSPDLAFEIIHVAVTTFVWFRPRAGYVRPVPAVVVVRALAEGLADDGTASLRLRSLLLAHTRHALRRSQADRSFSQVALSTRAHSDATRGPIFAPVGYPSPNHRATHVALHTRRGEDESFLIFRLAADRRRFRFHASKRNRGRLHAVPLAVLHQGPGAARGIAEVAAHKTVEPTVLGFTVRLQTANRRIASAGIAIRRVSAIAVERSRTTLEFSSGTRSCRSALARTTHAFSQSAWTSAKGLPASRGRRSRGCSLTHNAVKSCREASRIR